MAHLPFIVGDRQQIPNHTPTVRNHKDKDEECLKIFCINCENEENISRVAYLPFLSLPQQEAIPPWFPIQGPVAVEQVKLIRTGGDLRGRNHQDSAGSRPNH